jgi:hypothetical protein
MRWKTPLAVLVVLALAGGAWALVRARINATALAGTAHDIPKPHRDQPPHGGTAIGLGDDQFNLELVRDPAAGTLKAFVLDGEMEDFIRIKAKVLEIEAEHDGRKETLKLLPVADAATGETVGDTCLFQTRADWLKRVDHFKGTIRALAIQDQSFKSVAFAFPEGNGKE